MNATKARPLEVESSGEESDDYDADAVNEDNWDDWEDDSDSRPAKCLLCPIEFLTIEETLKHGVDVHKFDLLQYKQSMGLDLYGTIKLINYIRATVLEQGGEVKEFIIPSDTGVLLNDEKYLQPVLPDDPFLQHYFEEDWSDDDEDQASGMPQAHGQDDVRRILAAKELELQQLRAQLEDFQTKASDMILNQPMIASSSVNRKSSISPASAPKESEPMNKDEGYIDGYSHYGIHEEMLKDIVRTLAYRDAMYKNPDAFKDKIVLDVGCGTGILSMMASKAGAAHVYGIDFSAVAEQAAKNVEENGLNSKVTIIRGKVEEIELPVEKVDIIISEWMGYFLIFESMYSSVLWARDKWLAPDGIVLPDQATIYLTALEGSPRVDYWSDVYGFKMTAMKSLITQEAAVEVVDPERIAASTALVYSMDMQTLGAQDTGFKSPFHLLINRDAVIGAFMAYFDVIFEYKLPNMVHMTTHATNTPTHWKQTVLHLDEPIEAKRGYSISGEIWCAHDKENPREIVITVVYAILDTDGKEIKKSNVRCFKM